MGNKCDLDDKKEVTFKQGLNYANEIGSEFCEVSAKNDIGINELFELVGKKLAERDAKLPKSSSDGTGVGDRPRSHSKLVPDPKKKSKKNCAC